MFPDNCFQWRGYALLHCPTPVLIILILCDIVLWSSQLCASLCWFRICLCRQSCIQNCPSQIFFGSRFKSVISTRFPCQLSQYDACKTCSPNVSYNTPHWIKVAKKSSFHASSIHFYKKKSTFHASSILFTDAWTVKYKVDLYLGFVKADILVFKGQWYLYITLLR